MAKMFGSNVGLENVSSSSNRIEGACHGIPNSGNTCYIGETSKSGIHEPSGLYRSLRTRQYGPKVPYWPC